MKRLNNNGRSIQPCFTPTRDENNLVNPYEILTEYLTVEYIFLIILCNLPLIPYFYILENIVSLNTVSKALRKSTKQAYTRSLDFRYLPIIDFNVKMYMTKCKNLKVFDKK